MNASTIRFENGKSKHKIRASKIHTNVFSTITAFIEGIIIIVLTYFIHRGPTEYPDVLDLLTKGCGLEAIQSGGEGRGNQMSTRRDLISVGGEGIR